MHTNPMLSPLSYRDLGLNVRKETFTVNTVPALGTSPDNDYLKNYWRLNIFNKSSFFFGIQWCSVIEPTDHRFTIILGTFLFQLFMKGKLLY